MSTRAMIPLIDIVFLSLGSLLAVMTQMEHVKAIEVDVSSVGRGISSVQNGPLRVVTLTAEGLTLDGIAIEEPQFNEQLGGQAVILRAERTLQTEKTLHVLAALTRVCASVAVEVEEQDRTGS